MNVHHLPNHSVPLAYSDVVRMRECVAALDTVLAAMAATFERALDRADGDPDLEDNNDREATDGDDRDISWIEWHKMRGSQKRGPNIAQLHEDDEEDDPSGQYDEDYYTGPAPRGYGAGCPISDPDKAVDDDPCDPHSEDGY